MEIGRVALLTSGPQAGKLVVIIDLVDQRRVCVCVSLSLSVFLSVKELGNLYSDF